MPHTLERPISGTGRRAREGAPDGLCALPSPHDDVVERGGGGVIAGAVAVAGCGSPQDSKVTAAALYRSPEQATLSWFYAINHRDKAETVAHFTPAAAGRRSPAHRQLTDRWVARVKSV